MSTRTDRAELDASKGSNPSERLALGMIHHRRIVHRLRSVSGIGGWVRLQPEFLANVAILLGVERAPVLGEQA